MDNAVVVEVLMLSFKSTHDRMTVTHHESIKDLTGEVKSLRFGCFEPSFVI